VTSGLTRRPVDVASTDSKKLGLASRRLDLATWLFTAAGLYMIVAPFTILLPSHAFDKSWPVHARFHLTWAAGKLLGLGIGELLLAHFPLRAGDLSPRLQRKRIIGLGRDKLTDGPRAPAAG
jgi:hypothetical protein